MSIFDQITKEILHISAFFSTGPEWYRIRSALNPKMLKLKEVAAYAPIIHEVVSDLLQRVELLRLRSPDQVTVKDLASELYKFGFEGVYGYRMVTISWRPNNTILLWSLE